MLDKTKKKLYLYKVFLFMLTGSLNASIYYSLRYKDDEKTLVKVSSDVRDSIYEQGNIDINDYFKSLDKHITYVPSMNKIKITEDIDKNITLDLLNNLNELEINLCKNNGIEIISNCPNLSKLTIKNSQMLTDSDIEFLNKTNIKDILLKFDLVEVNKIREDKFDISRFKNKNIYIEFQENKGLGEEYLLVLMNYLKNYNIDNVINKDIFLNYKKLDDKIDIILNKLDLDKYKDINEKIMILSNFVVDKIEYPKSIDEEELLYYNKKELSCVLDKDKEITNGVCISYASLLDIMCYKSNIKSRVVKGYDIENDTSHAWNIIYFEDEKKFIDLTFADNNLLIKNNLFHFSNNGNEIYDQKYYLDTLKKEMYIDVEDNYKDFKITSNISSLDSEDSKKNITYFNFNLDYKKILDENFSRLELIMVFIISGFSSIILDEFVKTKKLEKKEKLLVNKSKLSC